MQPRAGVRRVGMGGKGEAGEWLVAEFDRLPLLSVVFYCWKVGRDGLTLACPPWLLT